MPLDDLLGNHDDEITALTAGFQDELNKMLVQAGAAVQATLMERLRLVDGKVAQTSANRAVLRKIDVMFADELDDLGLQELVNAFVGQFGGQLKHFKNVLEQTLGKAQAAKLGLMKFTVDEQKVLTMTQADAATNITDVVDRMGDSIRKKTLLGIGGLTPKSLAVAIADEVGKTPGIAKSEASTAISSFYRQVADTSFKKIEEDDDWEVRYGYVGPPAIDPLVRPFCKHLMRLSFAGRSWTRDEIDEMDNDQLDDVFVTGGGYNCRHQWIIAELKPAKPTKKDAKK